MTSPLPPEPASDSFPLVIEADQVLAALEQGAMLVDIRSGEGRKKIGFFSVGLAVEKADLLTAFSPTSRQRLQDIPVQQPVVFFCGNEATALPFVQLLRGVGLVNACNVVGGYDALKRAGLPMAPKG